MEIKKFNEQYNDKPYYKELGYDKSLFLIFYIYENNINENNTNLWR